MILRADCGAKHLIGRQNQAILLSSHRPLGEARFTFLLYISSLP
jgi:hypothetical protein